MAEAEHEANVLRDSSRQLTGKWDQQRRWSGDGLARSWGYWWFIPCVVAGQFHESEFLPDMGNQHGSAGEAAKYDRKPSLRTAAAKLENSDRGGAKVKAWKRHPRRRQTLAALEGPWEGLFAHAEQVVSKYPDETEAGYARDWLVLWRQREWERRDGGFDVGWELGKEAGRIETEWWLWATWGPELIGNLSAKRDDDGGSAARRWDWLNDQIRKRWPIITHDQFGRPLSFSGRMAAVSENIRDANSTVFARSPNLAKALEPNALRQRLSRLGFTAKAAS